MSDHAILPFRMKRTLSIVGAGRVGRTLGRRLHERGWRIAAVVTRSAATARAAVRTIGAGTPLVWGDCVAADSGPARKGGSVGIHTHEKHKASRGALALGSALIFDADVILITTADDDLPAVAHTLAKLADAKCKGKIILHTSATLDRALAPLARNGAFTGSLHPMQAFGAKVIPNLKGVIFAVEGDPKARRMAQSIAKLLGGIPIPIETRDKAIYHAAGVLAAGSSYPAIEAGVQLLMSIGFSRARAMQTLVPLLRQIFDNIERIGPRAAWTGPLSRGDYAIVARHAKALKKHPREFRQAYAALSLLAGRLLAKNRAAAQKQIKRALRAAS
jgi:predicted short-subunit dehydrogenase-like oxidoreductase (DUF2520 family)